MKSLCSSNCINDFEVLSARVEFNEQKQEAHFDYCQWPLQADSITHCKTVKEWNMHPYSFDMPKTSNFMAKMNTELYNSTTAEACDFQSPTTRFFNKLFLALTIMQSVET